MSVPPAAPPQEGELVAGPGGWRLPSTASQFSPGEQQQLDARRGATHWSEVDFVVEGFLAPTKRSYSVGRNTLDMCGCLTVLQMDANEQMDLLREALVFEGMDDAVTNGDLVTRAGEYWAKQGRDPQSVLAEALTASASESA